MNVYECTLVLVGGTAETHAVGAAIDLQVERVIGTQTVGGSGITDGDKGDITVSGSGTVWTIDPGAVVEADIATGAVTETKLGARSVTAAKLFQVGHQKLIGRHGAGDGDAQEIGLDGGLEFQGGNIRREALTGDVTASAGSNVTTIATGSVNTSKLGGDITTAGKALLDDVDSAAQRATLGLGTAATAASSDFAAAIHTHPLSALTQSGATTNQIIQWNGTAWVPVTFTAGIGGTLGTTDNALTRADGTGGTTAQGSGVTLDDSANLLATNWTVASGIFSGRTFARLGSVGTNLALILSPTGTGFIASQVPDGTATGGNLRGNNAIDFTYSRGAATQVASGAGSFNGGASSTASGADSFAWCGSASNGRTVAFFGNASGNWAIALGQASTSSGSGSFAAGEGASATGNYSSAVAPYANASGSFAVGAGYQCLASLYGQLAHASGRFAANGDCQRAFLVARRQTTDATASSLFLDGTSSRILVSANSSGRARIVIVARRATATEESITFERVVCWHRGVAANTTTIDVQTIGTDRGRTGGAWGAGPAWTIAINADTTNGGIDIVVTGAVGVTIRWIASIDWTETTNP